MLQPTTVEPATLELLIRLMQVPGLEPFALAGGTNLAHRYPLLSPFTQENGILFWSVEDVIAMKLGAVSGRGAKKDFCDLAELLNHFSLADMLGFFTAKYASSDPGYVVRSLTYFDDAEPQADPVTLNAVTWPQVKQRVLQAVKELV